MPATAPLRCQGVKRVTTTKDNRQLVVVTHALTPEDVSLVVTDGVDVWSLCGEPRPRRRVHPMKRRTSAATGRHSSNSTDAHGNAKYMLARRFHASPEPTGAFTGCTRRR